MESGTGTEVTQPPPRRSGVRIAGIVAISIGGLIGIALALGGLAVIVAQGVLRDDDGFYTTDTEALHSAGYAITTDGIDLGQGSTGFDVEDLAATLRFTVTGGNGQPAFVGVGREADVDAYLRGVAHSEVHDIGEGDIRYTQVLGRAPPQGAPGDQNIWVVQSEGTGAQNADFDLDSGTWTAVAMNPDASRGISIDGEAGVKIGWLIWVGIGLLVVGVLIAGSCAYGVYRLADDRRARSRAPSAPIE